MTLVFILENAQFTSGGSPGGDTAVITFRVSHNNVVKVGGIESFIAITTTSIALILFSRFKRLNN